MVGLAAGLPAKALALEVGTVSDSNYALIIIDLHRSYYQDEFQQYQGSVSFNLVNQNDNHCYASVLNSADNWYMLAHNVYIDPCYDYWGTIRMYIIAPVGTYVLYMSSAASNGPHPDMSATVVTVGAANSDWENYHPGEPPPYATY